MNLAILFTVFLLLYHLNVSSANLAKELEASLDRAMQCPNREPPLLPVLALTPHRFAQLLAVMRNMSGKYGCVQPQINAPFAAEDPATWKFCLFGKCNWDRCECLPTFTGPNCNLFTKKCWLMYCFLSSCHALVHSIYCVCDARYYGVQVTSGDYWYDDGKRNVFYPPPAYWQDDAEFPQVEQFGQTILSIPESNDPILAEFGIPGNYSQASSSKHYQKPASKEEEEPHMGVYSLGSVNSDDFRQPYQGPASKKVEEPHMGIYPSGVVNPNAGRKPSRKKGKKKGKSHKRPNSQLMQVSKVEYADEKPKEYGYGSSAQSGDNNSRHQASGVEYANEKPKEYGSSALSGPNNHRLQASGVEYADEKPKEYGSSLQSGDENSNQDPLYRVWKSGQMKHRLPSSKVEYADAEQSQDDTTEDLKEVLAELASNTSNSVTQAYAWTTVLVTALSLYVVLPYP